MQGRDIDRRIGGLAAEGEDSGGAGEQLLPPLADLVRMEFEALGELGQGGIAFQRREVDRSLEGGGVIPTGTTGNEGSNEVS